MNAASEKLFCVIGDPVSHSLSPFIMTRALDATGIDGAYMPMRVPLGQLPGAMAAFRAKGLSGANVTYPHKTEVLQLVDETSPAVDIIGAANTLVFHEDRVSADNTDCVGTVAAIETFSGAKIDGATVAVFGAGGAARAAAYGLLDAGAATVTLLVRDPSKRAAEVERLQGRFGADRIQARRSADEAAREIVHSADVVINATPLGMGGTDSNALPDATWVRGGQCCFDFVYHPRSTPFLRTAADAGGEVLEGLTLLVAQAQASFEIWTGHVFELGDMFDALTAELDRKR